LLLAKPPLTIINSFSCHLTIIKPHQSRTIRRRRIHQFNIIWAAFLHPAQSGCDISAGGAGKRHDRLLPGRVGEHTQSQYPHRLTRDAAAAGVS
jgi:hypothetical protein